MSLDSPGRLLDRFHEVLLSEIRDRRPEYLADSFTVAEIYQHLVPYASHRDRLGVEMNGDYEDVLLRLLAGEGDYLDLESAPARDRLRQELGSTNPDTSLYREFAAASVRLNPDRVAEAGPNGGAGLPEAEPGDAPSSTWDAAPGPEDGADGVDEADEPPPAEAPTGTAAESASDSEEAQPGPVASPVEGHPEPLHEAGAGDDGTCSWCREELPERDNLNFCPFCGTDVRLVPCPGCGEALEPRWRFCISCGTSVSGA